MTRPADLGREHVGHTLVFTRGDHQITGTVLTISHDRFGAKVEVATVGSISEWVRDRYDDSLDPPAARAAGPWQVTQPTVTPTPVGPTTATPARDFADRINSRFD